MLWYKAWLDTRWRFLIGLALLICTALANALTYPTAVATLEAARNESPNGPLASHIDLAWQLSTTFRGYIWDQVIHHNMYYLWSLFAVLLAADGPLNQRTGAIFTLTLPVSRRRLCAVRAGVDFCELGLLALLPLLAVSLAAPAVGHSYALADALIHAIHLLIGGTCFYCLTLLLAAFFEDRWRPILLTLAAAVLVGVSAEFLPALSALGPVGVMIGESYFRTGSPEWTGLLIAPAVAAVLFYYSVRRIENRDF
jgi:ABC-2 type transport system permease protein